MDPIYFSNSPGFDHRPVSLENGRVYLLRVRRHYGSDSDYHKVRFVGYTSCPGVIIVCDGDGAVERVARTEIFNIV